MGTSLSHSELQETLSSIVTDDRTHARRARLSDRLRDRLRAAESRLRQAEATHHGVLSRLRLPLAACYKKWCHLPPTACRSSRSSATTDVVELPDGRRIRRRMADLRAAGRSAAEVEAARQEVDRIRDQIAQQGVVRYEGKDLEMESMQRT